LGGLVVGGTDNTPIGGLTVTVTDSSGNLVAAFTTTSTTSPSNGTNFSGPIAPGTYTLTVSGTTVSDTGVVVGPGFTDAPTMKVPSLVINGSVTQGNYGGPVTNATVTVSSAGTVVGSTTTNSGNYQIELMAITGTYDVTVTAPGQTGTSAATVTSNTPATPAPAVITNGSGLVVENFNITASQSFAPGLYLFSTPLDYSQYSWNALFGPLSSWRSNVAIWQPALGQYVLDPTPPADVAHIGVGYWIKVLPHVGPNQVAGDGTDITEVGVAPAASPVAVTLSPGWNQIGVPSNVPIALSGVEFTNPGGGSPIPWQSAISSAYGLVSPTLYSFNPTANNGVGAYVAQTTTLMPWSGYWIYAYQNATILLPTGGAL
jgi:hypothetical protein